MFKKTRAVKRFVRRNKTKFFVATTVVATSAALINKGKANIRLDFIQKQGLEDQYDAWLISEE